MTTIAKNQDRLFELLPALYQIADADRNHELRALLRLITKQSDALRDDTQQLWDDFFIETCQRWVIPYIGDLVGNIPLHDLDLSLAAATAAARFTDLAGPDLKPPGAIRLRADVSKTINYRRRKGTPPMLEELARDVTGWDAHIVEFFTLLDWNQHLEHLRLGCHGCPDLRRVDVGDRAGGPWDTTTHTVDVRRINEWDGWYNIPNIGFFLWRLEAFRLTRVTPRAIGGTNWRLTFSPLGQDIPLFSAGRREPGESRMATELTIALPIRAAAFFEDLATVPSAPPPTPSTGYYGGPVTTQASLVVFANGIPLTADQVKCTNLENWTAFAQPGGSTVMIDPTRGRLAIPTGRAGEVITASYFYGFSMATGGGEYSRAKWLVPSPPPLLVGGGGLALSAQIVARPPAPRTVIEIQDDATYLLNADITLAANESLTLQAADGARPHVRLAGGSIGIKTLGSGASFTLGGLLIEGGLRIEGDLRTLRLLHTTMVPGRSVEQENAAAPAGFSLEVAPGPPNARLNTKLEVQMAFSIVGALRIPSHITQLLLLDSIVVGIDRLNGPWIPAVCDAANTSGPPAHVERSTLLGTSRFLKLELASESIFTGQVMVDQRQQGCVRFSFVPFGSQTPQQYRCQPALEIAEEKERRKAAAAASGIPLPLGWEAAVEAEIVQWLAPSFQTDRYGRPDFVQLRRTCPIQIRTGAADGSEMGVFCVLKQPQRESNLRIRLDEYLPVGLEAGLIYVT
jgi:hypothetical protein